MASRSESVARQRQESLTFLKELIDACERKVLEGRSEDRSELNKPAVTVTEAPAISAELEQLLTRYELSQVPVEKNWAKLARRTTKLATSLAGLLRKAFGAEGCGPFYASARNIILKELIYVIQEDARCPGFSWQVLGPVLLGMDTLECYSRILAEAAEQLATDFQLSERCGYWPSRPSLEDLEELVREPIGLFVIFGMAVSGAQRAPTNTASGRACSRTVSGNSSSKGSGKSAKSCGGEGSDGAGGDGPCTDSTSGGSSCSSSGGTGGDKGSTTGGEGSESGSSSGGAKPPSPGARTLPSWTADKLQSSYVLEHWARLLLLGTSAAVAYGDSTQQRMAQALQARSLDALSNMSLIMGMGWEVLVLRPCGRGLAATHMAYPLFF